jgi:hypothetical protein
MHEFFPLLLSSFFFLFWGILFLYSKQTRKEQLFMSFLGLLLSPALLLTSIKIQPPQTILPVVGLTEFLFLFAFCGVAAVIYQVIIGNRLVFIHRKRLILPSRMIHWISHLIILLGIWIIISLVILLLFPLNFSNAFLIATLFIGIYIIADRHDLLLDALVSGVFLSLLVFTLEYVFRALLFSTSTEITIDNLLNPIASNNILWVGIVGFTIGPLYEYVKHLRFKV